MIELGVRVFLPCLYVFMCCVVTVWKYMYLLAEHTEVQICETSFSSCLHSSGEIGSELFLSQCDWWRLLAVTSTERMSCADSRGQHAILQVCWQDKTSRVCVCIHTTTFAYVPFSLIMTHLKLLSVCLHISIISFTHYIFTIAFSVTDRQRHHLGGGSSVMGFQYIWHRKDIQPLNYEILYDVRKNMMSSMVLSSVRPNRHKGTQCWIIIANTDVIQNIYEHKKINDDIIK